MIPSVPPQKNALSIWRKVRLAAEILLGAGWLRGSSACLPSAPPHPRRLCASVVPSLISSILHSSPLPIAIVALLLLSSPTSTFGAKKDTPKNRPPQNQKSPPSSPSPSPEQKPKKEKNVKSQQKKEEKTTIDPFAGSPPREWDAYKTWFRNRIYDPSFIKQKDQARVANAKGRWACLLHEKVALSNEDKKEIEKFALEAAKNGDPYGSFANVVLRIRTTARSSAEYPERIKPFLSGLKRPIAQIAKDSDAGDPLAQYLFATILSRTTFGMEDRPKAFALYQKSANEGWVPSMNALIEWKEIGGAGVAKNVKEADQIFEQMIQKKGALARLKEQAEAGMPSPQFRMGLVEEKGFQTGSPSLAEAQNWYRKAAKSGNLRASRRLAEMYLEGTLDSHWEGIKHAVIVAHAGETNEPLKSIAKVIGVFFLAILAAACTLIGLTLLWKTLKKQLDKKRKENEDRKRIEEQKIKQEEERRAKEEEKKRKEKEAKNKREKLLREGKIREKCTEPLRWKCADCGSESSMTEWEKNNSSCPTCGASSYAGEAICLTCKKVCPSAPGERNCHSLSIYDTESRIVF